MQSDSTLPSTTIPLQRLISGLPRYPWTAVYEAVGEAVIDERDAEFLGQFVWHHLPKPKGYGYARRTDTGGKRNLRMMHVEVWELHNGPVPDWKTVDHRNRNELDNRLSNLRLASTSEQGYNKGVPANSKTGFRGVHFYQRHQVFKAAIRVTIDGVRHRVQLGRFRSAEEAAIAYNHASRLLHGEFAGLNEIPDGAVATDRVIEIMNETESRCGPHMKRLSA